MEHKQIKCYKVVTTTKQQLSCQQHGLVVRTETQNTKNGLVNQPPWPIMVAMVTKWNKVVTKVISTRAGYNKR